LARIVYPIVLLPELYLNVESRLCWKVGAMALLIHVYWFHKFIQQQLRYYYARNEQKQSAAVKETEHVAVALKTAEVEIIEKESESEEPKRLGVVCEYEVTVPVVTKSIDDEKTPASPSDDKIGMDIHAANQIQVNGNRHRRSRVIRLSSGQSITSLTSFEMPTEKVNPTPAVAATLPAIATTTSKPMTTTTPTPEATASTAMGTKTMKQLLEECSDEDVSMYKFPIHNNKTFSAIARKPSNGSQGFAGELGVVRLSRASSMRDSKRRIALGAVQFANPSIVAEPKQKQRQQEKVEEKERKGEEAKVSMLQKKTKESAVDADATVVMRPRRTSPTRDGDYGFGTIRVSRGGVVAVNA